MSKKIYFLSDFHLGIDTGASSQERELKVVRFLESIRHEASDIYLMGDVFDFWYEYREVVPKGYIRLLGKLAELADSGIQLHYFIGNHDMWMFDYLADELDVQMYHQETVVQLHGRKLLIGHGDGLGPGDHGYKFIKKVFRNRICQWFFARIHPNLGIAIAKFWSGTSRKQEKMPRPWDRGSEWLVSYCEEQLGLDADIDYFIFGHRHLPIDHLLSNGSSRYVNLGDWMQSYSYAVLEEGELSLRFYDNVDGVIHGQD